MHWQSMGWACYQGMCCGLCSFDTPCTTCGLLHIASTLTSALCLLESCHVVMWCSGSSGELNPMAAMFGGFVGQEVVKALSGKFHPLFQWFYFDSVESMPEELLAAEEYEATGTRWVGGG